MEDIPERGQGLADTEDWTTRLFEGLALSDPLSLYKSTYCLNHSSSL